MKNLQAIKHSSKRFAKRTVIFLLGVIPLLYSVVVSAEEPPMTSVGKEVPKTKNTQHIEKHNESEASDQADEAASSSYKKPFPYRLRFGAELGFGQISEDYIIALNFFFGFNIPVPAPICINEECKTDLSSDIRLPLYFVVKNASFKEKNEGFHVAQWDEIGDYFRWLTNLSYGHRDEPFYMAFGKLKRLTIGNGTIVNNYANNFDPDHYELGYQFDFHSEYAGGTLLVNDVIATNLVAFNVYARPFSFGHYHNAFDRILFGFTIAVQMDAPRELTIQDNKIFLDGFHRPHVSESKTALDLGFNFNITSIEWQNLFLSHYVDVNLLGKYIGAHIGSEIKYVVADTFDLRLKAELRANGAGYIPNYITPTFGLDEKTFVGWNDMDHPVPVRTAADHITDSGMGGLISATFIYDKWLQLSGEFEFNHGPNNDRLTFLVQLQPFDWLTAGLFYFNQGGDLFYLFNPKSSYFTAEIRSSFLSYFYAYGHYTHRLSYNYDASINHLHDWELGVGSSFMF